jgi:hypothetical protein
MAVGYFGAEPAHAAVTITVTGSSGQVIIDGICDLREAVLAANTNTLVDTCNGVGGDANDVITIATTGTILLSLGPIVIAQGVTINGPGAGQLAVDGQGATQIFRGQATNDTTTITGLTLQHGFVDEVAGGGDGDGGGGGAIRSNGNLVLDGVALVDNVVGSLACVGCSGGGLTVNGPASLTMTNSTVSGNILHGQGTGGGIMINIGATAALTNVTISDNTVTAANGEGGGILTFGPMSLNNVTIAGNKAGFGGGLEVANASVVSLANSILANNVAAGVPLGMDCFLSVGSSINSLDYNLVQQVGGCLIGGTTTNNVTGVDPALGPLADNGGPTKTRAVGVGSVALDAANNATCVAADQRGIVRPQDGDGVGGAQCDIGAFEFVPTAVPPTTTTSTSSIPDAPTTAETVPDTPATTPTIPDPPTTTPTIPTSVTPSVSAPKATISAAAVGKLPETGTDSGTGVGLAVLFLAIGGTLVAINRRTKFRSS